MAEMLEDGPSAMYDVAIVGAGPVGTMLAALLGQYGLKVFIGDASSDVYPLPRAAVFDQEIMRLFQQLGLLAEIAPFIMTSERYIVRNGDGVELLSYDLQVPGDTGWAYYMLYQPGIEAAVRNRVAQDERTDLRTGVRFERLEQDRKVVRSTWFEGDTSFEITSRYLVGCDGAWSPVREVVGGRLTDLVFDEPWLVLDVVVDPDNDLPTDNIQHCDPERPTSFIVMGANRRRFEFMLKPGEAPEVMLSDATLDRLMAPWRSRGVREIERRAVYRFHALIADRWQADRVFLAGDAAHQMPPFAGQGMCSGMRDAAALAWRFALAADGGACDALLSTYEQERTPHVRMITEAAMAIGRVVCTLDPKLAAARDAQMLAAKAAGEPAPDITSPPLPVAFGLPASPRAGQRFFQPAAGEGADVTRLDDVLGIGAWLISREPASGDAVPGLRAVSLDDDVLRPFAAALDGWLQESGEPAVLVRADRFVFGTGEAATLAASFAAQTAGARLHANGMEAA